jgi:hypothetical protein
MHAAVGPGEAFIADAMLPQLFTRAEDAFSHRANFLERVSQAWSIKSKQRS